uniref:cytoskeleton-associated protein 2-like n=1 Tax=Centroberyx gerrardi TaxID=166262 RepID=UPI003AAE49D0
MDEGGTVSILCRKELRKQKLMEYLAAKGKLKLPNPKLYLRDDCRVKKPATSALKPVKGKENKAPDAVSMRNEDTKVQPQAGKVISHPTGTVSGGTYKVSVQKGGIFPGAQNANRPVAPSGPTQPKLKQKPVPKRTYTVASSQPKKQPNTGIHAAHPSSGKSFSNAARTALTQPNSKSNSCTNVTRSGPNKTIDVRMSLGPIVKTKTGLIPAVVQPRNTKSNLTCSPAAASATTTTTSIANRVHSSTSLSVSVSQRSTMAQRKTFPTTVVNKPVQKRTTATGTASAGFKIQARIQSNSKPLLDKPLQPSCKSQPSTGLKPTYVSSRRTTAPVKPDEKERVSKTAKSVFQPTNKAAQQRSEGEEAGNSRPCRVGSRTSSGPVSRCSSRAVNRFMQAAVAELGEKAKMHKQRDNKKGDNSAKVSAPQAGTIRAGIPLMPQTVPHSARSASQAAWATDMKTRAPVQSIPQTEGKKLTAAQEERMRKLQEWREARGISYKRPPMPVKPRVRRTVALPQPYWATMKEEDEAHSLICAVDRSLADCIKLLREGCPPDQVKEVLSRLPMVAQKFAKYWICQARLMEQQGNLDVLPMFEEAVRVVLEPVDELRTVVFEILKKKDEIQGPISAEVEEEEDQMPEPGDDAPECTDDPTVTPKPVRVFICGEKGDSSVVKYKITATPGGPQSQQRQPARVNGQEVRFFTPVRRSVRIERDSLRYPAALQDHDLCVASYNDLIAKEEKERDGEEAERQTSPSVHDTPMYVYRENAALKDQVLIQVVSDDA